MSLKHVDLPEGLEVIEDYAFANCQIESLKLPKSLIRVGKYAFENTPLNEEIKYLLETEFGWY